MKMFNLEPEKGESQKSFYGKAKVNIDDLGNITLYSYNTKICSINRDNEFIKYWGGWSLTTMRHINSFRERYGLSRITKKEWDKIETQ